MECEGLTCEQEDRAVALEIARDLLVVKSGQYAERPLDPEHLIRLADWILTDPPSTNVTVDLDFDAVEFGRSVSRSIQRFARAEGAS